MMAHLPPLTGPTQLVRRSSFLRRRVFRKLAAKGGAIQRYGVAVTAGVAVPGVDVTAGVAVPGVDVTVGVAVGVAVGATSAGSKSISACSSAPASHVERARSTDTS